MTHSARPWSGAGEGKKFPVQQGKTGKPATSDSEWDKGDSPLDPATSPDAYQEAFDALFETVKLDHIKRHYYGSHESINPSGIVPRGPEIDFTEPHGRD